MTPERCHQREREISLRRHFYLFLIRQKQHTINVFRPIYGIACRQAAEILSTVLSGKMLYKKNMPIAASRHKFDSYAGFLFADDYAFARMLIFVPLQMSATYIYLPLFIASAAMMSLPVPSAYLS